MPHSSIVLVSVRRPAPWKRQIGTHPIATSLVAGAGLALVGAAVINAVKARLAELRHPPKGRFLTMDGVRLHYREAGAADAPAVLLLHGNGAMAEDFAVSGLLERLANRYRVIAFDRPGFGFSDRSRTTVWTPSAQAELFTRALFALGVERATVLGHSWGSMVALAMGLEHRGLVRGLVLSSGYYFPSMRLEVPFFAVPAIPIIGDLIRYTISPPIARAIAPRLIRRIFAPKPVPRRFAAGFPLDLAVRPSQLRASAAESALMVPAAATLQPRYTELFVPTAIITGAADEIVDAQAQSARLHAILPQSSYVELPGVGHMVHYSAQIELAAAVEQLTPVGGRSLPASLASQESSNLVPTVPGIP
jgi:pimeloyl-ACP methyl ester carboxylesterase